MLEDAIISILALIILVQPPRLILLLPRLALATFVTFATTTFAKLQDSLGPLVEPSVLSCQSALPLQWQTTESS